MHQYPRFSASRARGNHHKLRFFIDDRKLRFGEICKELFKARRGHSAPHFFPAVGGKVLAQENVVVKRKVVVYVGERRFVVSHHEVCVLAHDVNLLQLLAVVAVKKLIVFGPVAPFGIGHKACDEHALVEHHKAPLQPQCPGVCHKKERVFDVSDGHLLTVRLLPEGVFFPGR